MTDSYTIGGADVIGIWDTVRHGDANGLRAGWLWGKVTTESGLYAADSTITVTGIIPKSAKLANPCRVLGMSTDDPGYHEAANDWFAYSFQAACEAGAMPFRAPLGPPLCSCGNPDDPNVIHRSPEPCYGRPKKPGREWL